MEELVARADRVAQLLLDRLAGVDRLSRGDEVARPPGAIAHERDGEVHPCRAPVAADVTLLPCVEVALARSEPPRPRVVCDTILGVREILEPERPELLFLVPEDLGVAPVHAQPAPVERDVGDADRRVLEGDSVARLAPGERAHGAARDRVGSGRERERDRPGGEHAARGCLYPRGELRTGRLQRFVVLASERRVGRAEPVVYRRELGRDEFVQRSGVVQRTERRRADREGHECQDEEGHRHEPRVAARRGWPGSIHPTHDALVYHFFPIPELRYRAFLGTGAPLTREARGPRGAAVSAGRDDLGGMAFPGDHDPLQDANFQALVNALAREGLPRRAEAARAVEAVMCALAQRTSRAEYDELREHLPEPFGSRLTACERHAAQPPRELRLVEDFYAVVAEDLERGREEVESAVRAVFAALRTQMSEADAELVGEELPLELVPLWRRPS